MSRFNWGGLSSWAQNFFFSQEGKNYVYSLTSPNDPAVIGGTNNEYSEIRMMQMFESIAEFAFAVNAVASRVQGGEYILVDKNGEEVTDNKLWNKWITQGVNWKDSFEAFKWYAVAYLQVTGNRYGYQQVPGNINLSTGGTSTDRTIKVRHKDINQVFLLPSHYVFPMLLNPRPSWLTCNSPNDYINYYSYTGTDALGQITPNFVVHEMVNFMGDLADIVQWKGRSPFRATLKNLHNLEAVYEARAKNYRDGGPRGMWVNKSSDAGGNVPLSPKQREEVELEMMSTYGMGRGQRPFGFTNQPLAFFKTGSNIQELEPFKETEADAAALAGVNQIPMSLLPGVQSKYSNLDIAERNLYEVKIFSEANALCHFITKLGCFDELGYKVMVNFDTVTCLQDDALKFAQAFQANADGSLALYQAKAITLNQLLEKIGFEAVDGGDDYLNEDESVDTTNLTAEQEKAVKKALQRLKKHPNILWGKPKKNKKQNCFVKGKE